jgi:hypothetical protein
LLLQAAGVAFDVARRGLILFAFGQFEDLGSVADTFADEVEFLDLARQACALAPQFLRPFGL